MDLIELIIVTLRKNRERLLQFFTQPGQLIIHIDPSEPRVQLEVKVAVKL